MYKKKQPKLDDFFKLPNPGLWAYFKHTVDGNREEYRTPIFKGKRTSDVVQAWDKVFQKLGVKDKLPGFYDFEMEMKGNVGPLSVQKPLSERIADCEQYYTDIEAPSVPVSQEAIDATVDFFGKAKGIRMRSRENTVKKMRLSTNSGPWLFIKRRLALPDTLAAKIEVDRETHVVYAISHGKRYTLGAVLGWRGQEHGPKWDDVKQRVVFMMSFLLNVLELQFYQPAIEAIQKHRLIPAYVSMELVDEEITKLFDTKSPEDLVICTDFKRFDQHFNNDCQEAAHKIEARLASISPEMESWFRDIFPAKFYVPLICSENLMFEGPHGMGSGSGGTNFDECMTHKSFQFEACLEHNTRLNPHSMAYGDDGVLTAPGLTVDDVIQTYTKHGQVMNPDKQYASTHDCVYLRRYHTTDYRVNGIMVGLYSTFRALGRLLEQERFYDPEVWGPKMVALRCLSILENCNQLPEYIYNPFIEFVLTGDKFKLGATIPGFLSGIANEAKMALELAPDFMGYTKTIQNASQALAGIENWRIVKWLRKKFNV